MEKELIVLEIAKLYCKLPPKSRQTAMSDDRIMPEVKNFFKALEEHFLNA